MLSFPRSVSARERKRRVDELISSFGLQKQAHTLVGTPIRRGISGGQKRRLSIASQLITAPKILFLDVCASFGGMYLSLCANVKKGTYQRFRFHSKLRGHKVPQNYCEEE